MIEILMHDPVLAKDEDLQTVICKCSICGKILWFPEGDDECAGAPETLRIKVGENLGTEDIFGG